MPTLKTSINLQSTTLFPASVNYTKAQTYSLAESISGFTTVTVSDEGSYLLYDTNSAPGVAYLYAEAASANQTPITIRFQNKSSETWTSVAVLYPGESLYLPIWAEDVSGVVVQAKNYSSTYSAEVKFFVGEKA